MNNVKDTDGCAEAPWLVQGRAQDCLAAALLN